MKKREFTYEEQQLIKELYEQGETQEHIRDILHCKHSTLVNFLRDNGMDKRKKNTLKNSDFLKKSQKYSVNEKYFESIDTQEKAYWLGFLYADGCVLERHDNNGNHKGTVMELALKKDDEEHLRSFLYDIGANYPIKNRTVLCRNKKFDAVRTIISNTEFCKHLIAHGCVPNKTFVLQPPDIDDALVPHFIRGYFDGDGSLSFNNETKSRALNLLGTKELLEFIKEKSGISKNIHVHKVKDENVYCISINGKESMKTFCQFIYADKTVFLERKWKKALMLMKHLNCDTCRSETAAMADLLD
jgi:intein-encoded DNA endonuclease-like protein